jgi:cytochrome P450
MLDTLYGYKTSQHGTDRIVALINQVMLEFSEATVAGAWLVDLVPWLRHLPDWFPGTRFKQLARQWNKSWMSAVQAPMKFVMDQRASNSAHHSYVLGLLEQDPDKETIDLIKYTANALYAGGADTSVAALNYFILAMSLHPKVQIKAREEIDRVVGTGRLPGFQDRDSLPYIEAVVKETLRWRPLAPLGLPHTTDQEETFRGFRIPKGAIILPSIKWLSMDPKVYHDPHLFKPERFMGSNPEPSPHGYVFGFGRRICPGRLLADSSLYLTVALSLSVFDIENEVSKNIGEGIEPILGVTPGIISHPLPFQFRVSPRSSKHVELIKMVELEHPWSEGDDKLLKGLVI